MAMCLASNYGLVDRYYCKEDSQTLLFQHLAILPQAVTAYSPVLLKQAGYSNIKQDGLAGGINTIGIIGTIIGAQIIDRLGRRACLMGGTLVLFVVNLIVCIHYTYHQYGKISRD